MSELARKQKIVTETEQNAAQIANLKDNDLIRALAKYVDACDFMGVKRNPPTVANALKAAGYKDVEKLTAKQRECKNKKDFGLCIIGNVISSADNMNDGGPFSGLGYPPPNVMANFSSQYLDMD